MAPKRKQLDQDSEPDASLSPSASASESEVSESDKPSTSKGKAKTKAKTSTVKKAKVEPKPKVPKAAVIPLDSTLPNNTAFPTELVSFPKIVLDEKEKGEGEGEGEEERSIIRLTAWNVCGIKACDKKGLKIYLEKEDADLVILTETKSLDPNFDYLNQMYPYRYFGESIVKGQAGTAILSKIKPISVVFGLPTSLEPQKDSAGRIVTLEFSNTFVVGTYVVNAGQGLKTIDKKIAWNVAFELYLRQLDTVKPVIWTGDLNVVQTEKDIRNWKTNYNKSAGCTDLEIQGIQSQLNPTPESGHKKLVDVWRHFYPEREGYYTYFSYKFQCRSKGIGWRIDSFIVSERIVEKVKQCEIRLEVYGASDHVPVMCDIIGPL